MFDCVVVGSGPISLLEGLFLLEQGKSVLVVEQDEMIGGAWRTVESHGLPALEIGCHIWDIDDRTYAFLADYLGLELEAMTPAPQIVSGNLKVPYARKNLIIAGKNAMGSLKRGKIGSFFKFSGEALSTGATLFPKKYMYPKGGSSELMAGLERKIAETGLEIRTNTRIENIDVTGDGVSLRTSSGTIECKELVITTFSKIKSVTYDGETEDLPVGNPRDFIHFHLVFSDTSSPNLSYVRLMQDPVIHRVSDVTSQLNFADAALPGKRVLIVGVHESAYSQFSEDELIEQIVKTVKRMKHVGVDATLDTFFQNVYHTWYFGREDLDGLLEKCGTKVRSVHSTNFIHDVRRLLLRWRRL